MTQTIIFLLHSGILLMSLSSTSSSIFSSTNRLGDRLPVAKNSKSNQFVSDIHSSDKIVISSQDVMESDIAKSSINHDNYLPSRTSPTLSHPSMMLSFHPFHDNGDSHLKPSMTNSNKVLQTSMLPNSVTLSFHSDKTEHSYQNQMIKPSPLGWSSSKLVPSSYHLESGSNSLQSNSHQSILYDQELHFAKSIHSFHGISEDFTPLRTIHSSTHSSRPPHSSDREEIDFIEPSSTSTFQRQFINEQSFTGTPQFKPRSTISHESVIDFKSFLYVESIESISSISTTKVDSLFARSSLSTESLNPDSSKITDKPLNMVKLISRSVPFNLISSHIYDMRPSPSLNEISTSPLTPTRQNAVTTSMDHSTSPRHKNTGESRFFTPINSKEYNKNVMNETSVISAATTSTSKPRLSSYQPFNDFDKQDTTTPLTMGKNISAKATSQQLVSSKNSTGNVSVNVTQSSLPPLVSSRGHEKITSGSRGNENITSGSRGNEKITSHSRGNENITFGSRGNEKITSGSCGNENITSGSRGNENITSGSRGNEKITSGSRGNENITSGSRGNEKITSGSRGNENITSGSRGNENITSGHTIQTTIMPYKSNPSLDNKLVSQSVQDSHLIGTEDLDTNRIASQLSITPTTSSSSPSSIFDKKQNSKENETTANNSSAVFINSSLTNASKFLSEMELVDRIPSSQNQSLFQDLNLTNTSVKQEMKNTSQNSSSVVFEKNPPSLKNCNCSNASLHAFELFLLRKLLPGRKSVKSFMGDLKLSDDDLSQRKTRGQGNVKARSLDPANPGPQSSQNSGVVCYDDRISIGQSEVECPKLTARKMNLEHRHLQQILKNEGEHSLHRFVSPDDLHELPMTSANKTFLTNLQYLLNDQESFYQNLRQRSTDYLMASSSRDIISMTEFLMTYANRTLQEMDFNSWKNVDLYLLCKINESNTENIVSSYVQLESEMLKMDFQPLSNSNFEDMLEKIHYYNYRSSTLLRLKENLQSHLTSLNNTIRAISQIISRQSNRYETTTEGKKYSTSKLANSFKSKPRNNLEGTTDQSSARESRNCGQLISNIEAGANEEDASRLSSSRQSDHFPRGLNSQTLFKNSIDSAGRHVILLSEFVTFISSMFKNFHIPESPANTSKSFLHNLESRAASLREEFIEYKHSKRNKRSVTGVSDDQCHQQGSRIPNTDFHILCSICVKTTTLHTDFFPRHITEKTCKNDGSQVVQSGSVQNQDGCLNEGGRPGGFCQQQSMPILLLHRNPGKCMKVISRGQEFITDQWKLITYKLRTGCECVVDKNSQFAKYLTFG